ncbi:MAG: amidohydrolase family protein [Acidobacteria bacterium]|nr:amidohydrolase family protein [Acidobacteriota bacterium]
MTLAASWVVPVDRPPIRDGRVVVEGDRVTWVGPAGDPAAPGGPVRDLGSGVLLPSLVNAHTHLELSHLRGLAPLGRGFVPWVEGVVAARTSGDEEEAAARTAEAIELLEKRGTAAVGDVSNRLAHLDVLMDSRLRAVVFLEVLAWDPARAAETERWVDERIAAARRHDRVEVRLGAHAPHSVSPELLRRLAERGGIGALHLAESPEESRFLEHGDGAWAKFLARRGLGAVPFAAPGTSPVRYADDLGLLHPALVAAHGVQVDAADREILARRGVSVVLCPRSNRNLGVGRADVPALLAAGVRLCLGSDSLAGVDTLDVLDDAALLARQFTDLDPAALVRMATAGGAEALGFEDLGTLEPGKTAALAFAAAETPPEDPYTHLLSGAASLQTVEVG